MKKYVIGIGEALFDCLPEGRKLGGAPANFAYHVSQFGLNGCAVSAIGEDELGQEIVDKFTAIHNSLSTFDFRLSTVEQPTGTVKVTLDDKGVPQYEICLGVAWDNIPLTDEMLDIARHAQAVCFGSLAQRSPKSRETIQAFLDATPDDTLRVFDINLRQQWYTADIIAESLNRANILKINDEELDVVATMLLGEPSVPGSLIAEDAEKTRRVCRELIARYALDMVILTCGAIGSYVFTETRESYVATPKVQVADTVGAGDSFTATFVAQLLQGKTIPEAHRKAVAVSAFVCTQHGAMPILPEELKKSNQR
ncbi:MAG: carbohydrate kinase [Paludibacteraceae bacterium]|nr:carbohydrate kinase [Paludibacteraceae bacterium]